MKKKFLMSYDSILRHYLSDTGLFLLKISFIFILPSDWLVLYNDLGFLFYFTDPPTLWKRLVTGPSTKKIEKRPLNIHVHIVNM